MNRLPDNVDTAVILGEENYDATVNVTLSIVAKKRRPGG